MMPLQPLILALLSALPAQAQVRSAVLRAPSLRTTLSAPQTPSLAAPSLTAPPVAPVLSVLPTPAAAQHVLPALALPKAAASAQAAAAPPAATAAPAAREALAQTVQAIARGGERAQAPALTALFSGAVPRTANAVLGSRPSGAAPQTVETLGRRLAPALAEEAVSAARRMAGRTLSAAEQDDVARRTRFVAVGWAKLLFNEFGVMASYPDGVARPDLSIELTMKKPARLPDPEAYYRALFAHEYTHRLQFEGDVTRRWGIEVPPVAVELLRGIELVGLDGLKAGRIPFITENVLAGFASGTAWAQGARNDDTAFYHKGTLAGAAWALAARTGRGADAWEFVRRVSSARQNEAPGRVFADILAR